MGLDSRSCRGSVHPRVGGEREKDKACAFTLGGSSPRGRGTRVAIRHYRATLRFIPAWAGNASSALFWSHRSPIHPRVGGERARARTRTSCVAGSSPRGRGTPVRVFATCRHERFIPAWAGNATRTCSPSARASVHPRVGGERYLFHSIPSSIIGSSPRGRGTRKFRLVILPVRRFIPAWAGNASDGGRAHISMAVHPRVGGERVQVHGISSGGDGSSLRGRGTLLELEAERLQDRFIPAWAGNAPTERADRQAKTVHPRVGGERKPMRAYANHLAGSSPRGRGTLSDDRALIHCHRFIPAWAGNARLAPGARAGISVHPRVGGERVRSFQSSRSGDGSSPRGRGTRLYKPSDRIRHRFIPAWAGNARDAIARTITTLVHPRVGGERFTPPLQTRTPTGSSPRGRGTLSIVTHGSLRRRFIPAWAGNAFPL